MSHEHTSLDAAATERKARLAKLASLKRKRPGAESDGPDGPVDGAQEQPVVVTDKFISGRNYDIATKGPKLGFEEQPELKHETVEQEAERLASAAAVQAARDEEEAQKGIDLFKLQPKKPNWDLKRDLAERTKILDARTHNAIAHLVRERIQKAKEEAERKQTAGAQVDQGEELGVEGSTLVEAVHLREKEDEENRRREESDDEDGIS